MNLLELSALIQSEQACEEYLRKVGILKTYTECPKCKSPKIGKIRRNKHRCYSCKYEWHIRKGSVLEGMILEYSKFIACVKMFEFGIPIKKCSKELQMANESIMMVYNWIRKRIAELDQNDYIKLKSIKSNSKNAPIISIQQSKDKVDVEIYNGDNSKNIGFIYVNLSKNELNQNTFDYELRHLQENSETNLNRYDIIDRFWRHAKIRLVEQNITTSITLFLILKELEFKFNNREKVIFDLIIQYLVAE